MTTKAQDVAAVKEVVASKQTPEPFFTDPAKLDYKHVISTGSTLLDLAISGGRVRGGGLPGGLIVEIYGQSGLGKTQLLDELMVSAQSKGGGIKLLDPEARFKSYYYEQMYGLAFPKNSYHQPNTVSEMFDLMWEWKKDDNKGKINLIAADSLAALSTNLEMESSDKMGMRRAKEFSEGLRKTARLLAESNKLFVATNQIRQGDYGEIAPGGKAFSFYSSIRLHMKRHPKGWEISKNRNVDVGEAEKKKEMTRQIGVRSLVKVIKNSLDHPFREAPLSIVFDYGVDDIGDMLQWYKDVTGDTKYVAVDKKYQAYSQAISHIEKEELYDKLRAIVIDTWIKIESGFRHKRPKKHIR